MADMSGPDQYEIGLDDWTIHLRHHPSRRQPAIGLQSRRTRTWGLNTAGQFVDFLVYLRYVPLRSDHPECMTDHRVWECGEKTPAGPMNCLGYQQDALIWRGDPISKTEIESVLAPN